LITSTVNAFAAGGTEPGLCAPIIFRRFGSFLAGTPGRKAAMTWLAVPNVTTLSESMKLCRTSCMTPSLLASASFSASPESRKRHGIHGDRLVFLLLDDLAAASTCMFSRTP
jgi:hypothetical protein